MLVVVVITALIAGVSIEEISLLLSLLQTLLAIASLMGGNFTMNSFLVESGMHGVVQNW